MSVTFKKRTQIGNIKKKLNLYVMRYVKNAIIYIYIYIYIYI